MPGALSSFLFLVRPGAPFVASLLQAVLQPVSLGFASCHPEPRVAAIAALGFKPFSCRVLQTVDLDFDTPTPNTDVEEPGH